MATRRIGRHGTTREAGEFSGLRFAVYARKSNDDARNEDHRSTARQVAQARAYVEGKGGTVMADHLYQDDAVSGAEFRNRAGLLRLLDAVKNGRPFNAVVMSEESRLGREQVETSYILKQILDANVRLFYYMEDREARLDSAMDKIMSSLTMFGAELEREKAKQRARDAAERKARQGFVTGGEPFGYENVHCKDGREVPRGSPHDYVKRRIKDEEAEVVRSVFQMYAAGYGQVVIAKTMNGHPSYAEHLREFFRGRPPAPPRGRSGSWAPAQVREMLYRRLFRGEIVWGQYTGIDRNGRAGLRIKRDPSEVLVVPAEELRIIHEPLWEAVQRRLQAVNATYLRDCRGKLAGKPDQGREGKYLLSGLAMCGLCRWNLAVLGGVRRVYGCTHHHRRGVCANGLAQPVALVDGSFLAELERTIMTPANFTYAVEAALDHVHERLAREPDVISDLQRERKGLQQTLDKWEAAPLRDPEDEALLLPKVKAAKARITEIDADLARLAVAPKTLDPKQLKGLEREIEGELARFADLITGNVPRARQALKKLLVDRVVFAPATAGNGKETYAFKGDLSYGALVRGSIYPGQSPLGTPPTPLLTYRCQTPA